MSQYYQSNIQIPDRSRHYTIEEVSQMTPQIFDELPIADAIYIYNNYPAEYARLTGNQTTTDTATAPQDTPQETDAERFAREFEERVDQAIARVFHPNGA